MTFKSYGVLNVEQLAERFEVRARLCNSIDARAEAKVWREAAAALRETEFVGWKQLQEEKK